ncbi:MAG: hypothetical protein F4Y78_01840 [Candidatus Dadabacteria bacterium]|nr:hypothetical protein [Candidatus Dadabacteria bacterium]MYA49001.1 hypothetical protein [Candidatus Dadabacteria bacterium]MYG82591.1 hypothetical protein [Candidatus Dadabacteria bacterium]MYK49510.1 hypothetical protein [Candidatus Dadabacteria bacterium]
MPRRGWKFAPLSASTAPHAHHEWSGERNKNIAKYFNAEDTGKDGKIHVHGQRIGFRKLKELEVKPEFLEDSQKLQPAVLTAYNSMALIFENGPP